MHIAFGDNHTDTDLDGEAAQTVAASDIDSGSGMPVAGGDIPVAQSNVALARVSG